MRYHLKNPAYRQRSRRAARAIAAHPGRPDCILQIGATFEPIHRGNLPYAVFSDSNIHMSLEGSKYGVSDAVWLQPAEFDAICRRETQYRDACVVFTISDYLRRSFVEDFGLERDRVCTVGAGPNLDLGRVPKPRTSAEPATRRSAASPPYGPGGAASRRGTVLLVICRGSDGRVPRAMPRPFFALAGLGFICTRQSRPRTTCALIYERDGRSLSA